MSLDQRVKSLEAKVKTLEGLLKDPETPPQRTRTYRSNSAPPQFVYTEDKEVLQDFTDYENQDTDLLAPDIDLLTVDNVDRILVWWDLGKLAFKKFTKATAEHILDKYSTEDENNIVKRHAAHTFLDSLESDPKPTPSSPETRIEVNPTINNHNEIKPVIINETTILNEQAKKFRSLRSKNPRGRIHSEEGNLIQKLTSQGMNPNQIAKELSRSRVSIARFIKRNSN